MPNFGDKLYAKVNYDDPSRRTHLKANEEVVFLGIIKDYLNILCYIIVNKDDPYMKITLPAIYFKNDPSPISLTDQVHLDWIQRHSDLGLWVYDTLAASIGDLILITRIGDDGSREYVAKVYKGKMTERFKNDAN